MEAMYSTLMSAPRHQLCPGSDGGGSTSGSICTEAIGVVLKVSQFWIYKLPRWIVGPHQC